MEQWRETLSVFGLLFGSGAVLGLLKYIIGHENKHKEIQRRLDEGSKDFKRNREDHGRIEEKLDAQTIVLKELLVHLKIRLPAQGFNGKK